MIRRSLAIVATLVVAAGCTSDEEPAPATSPSQKTTATADVEAIPEETPEPAPTTESRQTPEAELSQRGNIVKDIDEIAGAFTDDTMETTWLEFKITDVTVNGECTEEFAEPADNGHLIFVRIEVSTGSEWPEFMEGTTVGLDYEWSIVGEDGLTESALDTISTYGCLPEAELLPAAGIGPGENATGTVILDSRNETGVLILRPWFLDGGWEWEF
jgi:hypothetical protein